MDPKTTVLNFHMTSGATISFRCDDWKLRKSQESGVSSLSLDTPEGGRRLIFMNLSRIEAVTEDQEGES